MVERTQITVLNRMVRVRLETVTFEPRLEEIKGVGQMSICGKSTWQRPCPVQEWSEWPRGGGGGEEGRPGPGRPFGGVWLLLWVKYRATGGFEQRKDVIWFMRRRGHPERMPGGRRETRRLVQERDDVGLARMVGLLLCPRASRIPDGQCRARESRVSLGRGVASSWDVEEASRGSGHVESEVTGTAGVWREIWEGTVTLESFAYWLFTAVSWELTQKVRGKGIGKEGAKAEPWPHNTKNREEFAPAKEDEKKTSTSLGRGLFSWRPVRKFYVRRGVTSCFSRSW